jgi:hypothetical protein
MLLSEKICGLTLFEEKGSIMGDHNPMVTVAYNGVTLAVRPVEQARLCLSRTIFMNFESSAWGSIDRTAASVLRGEPSALVINSVRRSLC